MKKKQNIILIIIVIIIIGSLLLYPYKKEAEFGSGTFTTQQICEADLESEQYGTPRWTCNKNMPAELVAGYSDWSSWTCEDACTIIADCVGTCTSSGCSKTCDYTNSPDLGPLLSCHYDAPNAHDDWTFSDNCYQLTPTTLKCAKYWASKDNYPFDSYDTFVNLWYYTYSTSARDSAGNPIPYYNPRDKALYECGKGIKQLPTMTGQPGSPCLTSADCISGNCNTEIGRQVYMPDRYAVEPRHHCTNGEVLTEQQYNNWINGQDQQSAINDIINTCGPQYVTNDLIFYPAHYEQLPGIMTCDYETPLQPNEQCLDDYMCNGDLERVTIVPPVTQTRLYFHGQAYHAGPIIVYQEEWNSCQNSNSFAQCDSSYGYTRSEDYYNQDMHWLTETTIIEPAREEITMYRLFDDSIYRVCKQRQCVLECYNDADCTTYQTCQGQLCVQSCDANILTPDASTKCTTDYFQQTNGCGQVNNVWGTKDCTCVYSSWEPSTDLTCQDEDVTQMRTFTSGEGCTDLTRTVKGTKTCACVPTNSVCANNIYTDETCNDGCNNIPGTKIRPCVPSNTACAANTCIGSTCNDGCNDISGTKVCTCTPDCSAKSSYCVNTTFSDGCSGLCQGTKYCAPNCVPDCSLNASYCSNQTFANNCGGICQGTTNCKIEPPTLPPQPDNTPIIVTGVTALGVLAWIFRKQLVIPI